MFECETAEEEQHQQHRPIPDASLPTRLESSRVVTVDRSLQLALSRRRTRWRREEKK